MISINRGAEDIYESIPDATAISENDSKIISMLSHTYSKPSQEIISISVKPKEAFEIFSGSIFYPDTQTYQYVPEQSCSSESPIKKLIRIKNELNDLRLGLNAVINEEKLEDSTNWKVLLDETNDLISNANSLENSKTFESLRDCDLMKFKDLIDEFNTDYKPSVQSVKVPSGVYFEKSSLFETNEELFNQLEKRIFNLEAVLGNASNTIEVNRAFSSAVSKFTKPGSSLGNVPLIESLIQLEEKVSLLDSTSLEGIRAKASALRIELEAASKAKASISETKAFDAYKKVEELHIFAQKVDTFVDELPAIVLRQASLENVHFSSIDFVSKLTEFDDLVTSLRHNVSNNKEVLDALKQNFGDNLNAIKDNLASIDARISNLTE